LAAVFEIIVAGPGSIAIAHGRMRPYLSSLVTRLAVMITVLVATAVVSDDLELIAVAMLVQSVLGAVITQIMIARPLGLPIAYLVRPMAVATGPATAMYAAVAVLLAYLTGWPA